MRATAKAKGTAGAAAGPATDAVAKATTGGGSKKRKKPEAAGDGSGAAVSAAAVDPVPAAHATYKRVTKQALVETLAFNSQPRSGDKDLRRMVRRRRVERTNSPVRAVRWAPPCRRGKGQVQVRSSLKDILPFSLPRRGHL